MTTTPSIDTVPRRTRMASTAAPSAPSLSPRPTQRAAARAAASVTRTSSMARLRSGAWRSAGVMPPPSCRRRGPAHREVRLPPDQALLAGPRCARSCAGTILAAVTKRDEWREAYETAQKRDVDGETMSGIPLEPVYGPDDGPFPGQWPYTRGPYATMYRSKLWTMRMFAGFGTADDTNGRFREILAAGGDGLSTAFDLPTLMGRDSDDPHALGEVGRCGVAIDTLADMEDLFAGIDLGVVTTSMTINSPAAMLLAMYVAVAENGGVARADLGGTIQNDILKEYQAQKEFIFPPRPSMRIVTDMIRFCATEMPRWHPVSVSGYHIREAGSTAAQELAFTLANGFAYVEAASATGLAVDEFAPRLSFFFNAHIDFFEEIGKYRAARRIWARWMRDRYHAVNARSLQLRFHTQTAGVSLTAQQPEVNIVRTAIEALAGVLGGTQSLHTNSRDEALSLPSEDSARLALRTQQIIAYESGVTQTADPVGGSEYIEALTADIERGAMAYIERIDAMGGTLRAIETGYIQAEIQNASFEYQKAVESGEQIVVGANRFRMAEDPGVPPFRIDPSLEQAQIDRLRAIRSSRDPQSVRARLERLAQAAQGTDNL